MKVLYFGGGLGNQIFEYTFYLALKIDFLRSEFMVFILILNFVNILVDLR